MTIIQAISSTDSLKFNTVSQDTKVSWLSGLDFTITREVLDTHEGEKPAAFQGYTPETPLETELLAPAPYDGMYLSWLQAQIDLANGEIDKYNVSILHFNEEYDAFLKYYNRTHMPLHPGRRFRF